MARKDTFPENAGRRENGNSGNKQMTEMVQAAVQEILKKLVPDTVFPQRVPILDDWKLVERKLIMMM